MEELDQDFSEEDKEDKEDKEDDKKTTQSESPLLSHVQLKKALSGEGPEETKNAENVESEDKESESTSIKVGVVIP